MKPLSQPILLCVVLVLLAPLLSPAAHAQAAAFPSDQAPITFVSTLGGSLSDAYVDGRYAYLIEGLHLTILDISDPTLPQVRSRVALPSQAYSLTAINGYVYVLRYGTLWIYDARDPAAPVFVRELQSPLFIQSRLASARGLLWVASRYFDLQDPTRPTLLGSLSHSEQLQEAGSLLYTLDTHEGLTIWDMGNPRAPVLRGRSAPAGTTANVYYTGVASDGTTLYITAWIAHGTEPSEELIFTLDMSDPAQPNLRATGTACAGRLYPLSGRLVSVCGQEILIYAITDPLHPSVEGKLLLAELTPPQVVGSQLYTRGDTTWKIIDLGGPSAPTPRGQYQTVTPTVYSVTMAGARLYAGFYTGLKIIDVTNPLSPTLGALLPLRQDQFGQISVEGTRLLMPTDEGFQLIDTTDALSPTVRATLPAVRAARLAGDRAYVASNADPAHPVFQILDISDMAHPSVLANISIPVYGLDSPFSMQVGDGRVYVGQSHFSDTMVTIVDVSNPRQLRAGAPFSIAGPGMTARGTLLFALSSKLQVIDARDINAPTVADFPSSGTPRGVEVVGSTAYLTDYDGLTLLDLRDPQHPAILHRFHPDGSGFDLQIIDGRIYVAAGGLRVLDIARSPLTPQPTAMYGAYVTGFAVADGYAYLAMGWGGLQIVQLHPERFVKPLLLPLARKGR